MPRLIAVLLMASFSLPLTVALVRANPQSDLPACCRRDGKHACAMMKRSAEASSKGPTVSRHQVPCAKYPSGAAIFSSPSVASPLASASVPAPPAGIVRTTVQLEILLRIAPAGACPKRGPPSPLHA